VIDVRGHKKWAFFFRVIGMNSILIYLSGHFIDWEHATRGTFGWLGEISPALWAPVIMSICYVMVKWLFLYFMYRQKLFLRV
jgi:predicted acyltransferase